MKKIKILTCYAGKLILEEEEIQSGLENMQSIVGGYLEHLSVTPEIGLWCNEEGKILNPPLPETIVLLSQGVPYDVVRGNVFFTSHNDEGDTIGLNSEHISEIHRRLSHGVIGGNPVIALEMS